MLIKQSMCEEDMSCSARFNCTNNLSNITLQGRNSGYESEPIVYPIQLGECSCGSVN